MIRAFNWFDKTFSTVPNGLHKVEDVQDVYRDQSAVDISIFGTVKIARFDDTIIDFLDCTNNNTCTHLKVDGNNLILICGDLEFDVTI